VGPRADLDAEEKRIISAAARKWPLLLCRPIYGYSRYNDGHPSFTII
jgi:hypothetical protein